MATELITYAAVIALIWSITHIAEWLATILKEKLAMATKPTYKRNPHRLAEAKAQFATKLGLDPNDPRVPFEVEDGTQFLIEHPMFRSKETNAALKDVDDDDPDGIAEVCLGDQYDSFIEHGGDPDDLGFLFLQLGDEVRAVQAGRRRPTRS